MKLYGFSVVLAFIAVSLIAVPGESVSWRCTGKWCSALYDKRHSSLKPGTGTYCVEVWGSKPLNAYWPSSCDRCELYRRKDTAKKNRCKQRNVCSKREFIGNGIFRCFAESKN